MFCNKEPKTCQNGAQKSLTKIGSVIFFLYPKKKEKTNTIGELILSQAQSFVSYGRSSSALYTFVRHGRKKLVGALCSIFSLFGLVFFLIAVIAKKLDLKLNCKERHLGVSMVCLIMHFWCNFS